MSGSRPRPYLGPVVALLVVLALGAGTVYAAIPNGSGKYSACLVKATGAVRLINYPKVKTCPAGEKLINWNAKGPQGPQGAQGPEGPQGPAGTSGSSNWGDIANKPADLADGVVGWGEVKNKPDDLADGVVGWGEVANKPTDLTDGQIGWAEIVNMPAGFADGEDAVDKTYSTIAFSSAPVAPGDEVWADVWTPVSLDVGLVVIPVSSLGYFTLEKEDFTRNGDQVRRGYLLKNAGSIASAVKVRAVSWDNDLVSPAAAKKAIKVKFSLRKSRR